MGSASEFKTAGEPGDQRFLLGRGPQSEGDRAGPADKRQAVGAEVDHSVGGDPDKREAQRGGQRTGQASGEGRCGRDAVGGGHEPVGGAVVAPGGGHPPVGGDALEAPEGQHRRHSAQRQRDDAEDGDRDQMAGGGVAGPQHHRGDAPGWRAGGRSDRRGCGPGARRRRGCAPGCGPGRVSDRRGSQPDSRGEGLGALVDDHVAHDPADTAVAARAGEDHAAHPGRGS